MDEKGSNLVIVAAIALASVVLLAWALDNYSKDIEELRNRPREVYERFIKPTTTTTTTTTTSTTTSTSSTTTTIRPESIECQENTDCGLNGTYVTREYTCYQGSVYRQYISYRCENPGTEDARCVGTEKRDFVYECGMNEACVEGERQCAFEGDVLLREMEYVMPNSTIISINSEAEKSYKGYSFLIVYVISQMSKPSGVAVDVVRPDGTEAWEYLKPEKGTVIGNLTVGLSEYSKTGREITAKIWVYED